MWDRICYGVIQTRNFFSSLKQSLMSNSDKWNIQVELKRIEDRLPDPGDDDEAANRFEQWHRKDPFPEVPASLLNASQFCEYVAKTGMIHPFYPSDELIKIATYDIKIGGQYVYWDDEGKKESIQVEEKDTFTLPQNSIGFVTLEPYFRIPDYIVPRFNLKIRHVYKGLLLGTGPIVDPGFQGRLSIPLHNLTTNDYSFRGGDPLISMEFTKLPKHHYIEDGNDKVESRLYIPFSGNKKEKIDRDVRDYIHKAANSRNIRSSIPQVFREAQKTVEKVQFRSFVTLIAAVITVGIGMATIAGLIWDLGQEAVREFDSSIGEKVDMIESHEATIDSLRMRIRALEDDE